MNKTIEIANLCDGSINERNECNIFYDFYKNPLLIKDLDTLFINDEFENPIQTSDYVLYNESQNYNAYYYSEGPDAFERIVSIYSSKKEIRSNNNIINLKTDIVINGTGIYMEREYYIIDDNKPQNDSSNSYRKIFSTFSKNNPNDVKFMEGLKNSTTCNSISKSIMYKEDVSDDMVLELPIEISNFCIPKENVNIERIVLPTLNKMYFSSNDSISTSDHILLVYNIKDKNYYCYFNDRVSDYEYAIGYNLWVASYNTVKSVITDDSFGNVYREISIPLDSNDTSAVNERRITNLLFYIYDLIYHCSVRSKAFKPKD